MTTIQPPMRVETLHFLIRAFITSNRHYVRDLGLQIKKGIYLRNLPETDTRSNLAMVLAKYFSVSRTRQIWNDEIYPLSQSYGTRFDTSREELNFLFDDTLSLLRNFANDRWPDLCLTDTCSPSTLKLTESYRDILRRHASLPSVLLPLMGSPSPSKS